MRFKTKPKPKKLERRVINAFLWFPLTIKNECRWLEKANVEQIYLGNKGWVSRNWVD